VATRTAVIFPVIIIIIIINNNNNNRNINARCLLTEEKSKWLHNAVGG